MGMFSQYDDYVNDEEEGLRSAQGPSRNQNDPSWDAEMKGVAEVVELLTGTSSNPKNKGRPYFLARLKITDLWYQDVPAEAEHEVSKLSQGDIVANFNWLPKDPDNVTLAEGFQLDEAIRLGSAIIGLKDEYFEMGTFDDLVESDGERVKGMSVGFDIQKDVTDEGDCYFNGFFFPVDDNGERVARKTPDELKAERAA